MSNIIPEDFNYRNQHPFQVWESIQKIPQLLSDCQRSETFSDMEQIAKQFQARSINKLILLGRGSSYFAALAARPLIEKITYLPVTCHVTNEFESYPFETCDGHTAVFFLSHSGKSEGDLRVVNYVKQTKAYTVAVTDVSESDLAKVVDQLFIGPGGKKIEYPATRTYATAIYRMLLLGLAIAQTNRNDPELQNLSNDLESLPTKIGQFIPKFEETIPNITDLLKGIKSLIVIGFGPNVANVEEAAMAFNQSTGISSQAYEMENYIHGPIQALNPESGVICLAPNSPLQDRMLQLAEAAHIIGARTVVIAPENTQPIEVDYVVKMPAGVPDLISSVLYMVPLWLISYHLGLTTGAGAHPDRLSMDKPEFQKAMKLIMTSDKWITKK